MKTLITLTLTAAEGGDNGVKIPANGIAIFDPKNGQVNADGDLVSGDRVKATVANGVLLDAEGNDGVWLEPGQYWASVASVTSRVTKYVEVPESDEPILLTSLFELEAVPAWRLTEGVVNEVKQARDEAVAAVEGIEDDIEQTVTDLLLSGEIELPPGEQGPEGPEGPQGPPGPPGADGKDGADGERGPEGPRGPKGEDGAPGAPGVDGNDGASAYQVAVAAGFAGSEAEWLDSLVGEEGPRGPAGADGADGERGPEGPEGPRGPQGERGPEGPQGEAGPQGERGEPGEPPQLLVDNIADATETGQSLLRAESQAAARSALGMYGGRVEDLEDGTSTAVNRLWSAKVIHDFVASSAIKGPAGADGKSAYQIAVDEGFVGDESAFLDSLVGPEGPQGPKGEKGDPGEIPDVSSFATKTGVADAIGAAEAGIRQDTSLHPNPGGQGLNYMEFFTSWDSYAETNRAWTQGFSINEGTEEIYVSAYLDMVQWIECRDYSGALKWRTPNIELPGDMAYSEGCPFYYNEQDELCFIVRIDPGGFVRTYNSETDALSDAMPVVGVSKLFADDKYFYCSDGDPTAATLTAVYVYSLESIKNGTPVLVDTIQLDQFGPQAQDNKPQGLAVADGFVYLSSGKRDANDDTTGRLDLRVFNATGRIVNAAVLNKADYRRVLAEQKRPGDTIPNDVSFENEGVYPLRDGRVATMNHLHRYVYITVHGVGSSAKVETDPVPLSNSSGWVDLELADGIEAYSATQVPQYRREGAIVFLRGAYKGVSSISGSENLALLPVGLRPAQNTSYLMKSNGDAYWRCDVGKNGYIKIVNYSAGTISASSWLPTALSFVVG